jgi:hypothetical protein
MNKSVTEAFDAFDEHIRLTDEAKKFALDEARKVSRLIGEHPAVKGYITTGSMVRSTAIRSFSDVDIVIILREGSGSGKINPKSMLSSVADIAKQYIANAQITGNTVSAISSNGTRIDILPALVGYIDDMGNQFYEIPAGTQSDWQEYSPDEQSKRITEMGTRLGPRFKKLIRAIKWWSQTSSQPLSSHQIEILAGEVFDATIPELPEAVVKFFDFAIASLERNSKDARAPSPDNAGPAIVDQGVLPKLYRARDLAKQAHELEAVAPRDADQAIRIWRRLFGEQFPAVLT